MPIHYLPWASHGCQLIWRFHPEMSPRVSTWSVADILKLASCKGFQPGCYPIKGAPDVRTCGEPLCSEGRADCNRGLEPQTQQRHISGHEFDFLNLNEFYFGSLALVVRMCVLGSHKQQDWWRRAGLVRFPSCKYPPSDILISGESSVRLENPPGRWIWIARE